MALEERQVDVEFTGGLETRDNRRRVIQGKLLDLENVCFPTADVPHRRPGTEVVADASTPALALASTERELLRWTANGIDSRAANGTWVQRGDAIDARPYSFDVRQVVARPRSAENYAVGYLSGYAVTAWSEVNGSRREVRATVIDEATGVRLIDSRLLGEDVLGVEPWRTQVRVVTLAARVLIFWTTSNATKGHLWGATFSPANPTSITAANELVSNLSYRDSEVATPYEIAVSAYSNTQALVLYTVGNRGAFLQRVSSALTLDGAAVDLGFTDTGYRMSSFTGTSSRGGLAPLLCVRSEQVTSAYSVRLAINGTTSQFRWSLDGGSTWSATRSLYNAGQATSIELTLPSTGAGTGLSVVWPLNQFYALTDQWSAELAPVTSGGQPAPHHFALYTPPDFQAHYLYYTSISGPMEARILNSALTTTARFTVSYGLVPGHVAAVRRPDGAIEVYAEPTAKAPISRGRITASGALVAPLTSWGWGLRLAGEAVVYGGRILLPCTYVVDYGDVRPGLQPTFFVVDGDAPGLRVLARALDGESGRIATPGTPPGHVNVAGLPRPYMTADGGIAFVVPDKGRPALEVSGVEGGFIDDVSAIGLSRVVLRELPPAQVPHAADGSALHVGGASPALYDGATWAEDGFHLYPEGLAATFPPGGALSAGRYSFVAVYEWTDSTGRRHQSTPSAPLSMTLETAGLQALVEVPPLRLTRKQGVCIALYRTEANGSIYYRTTPASFSYRQPDPVSYTASTVVINASASDAAIRTNEVLYRTGGELDHRPPPAYRFIHRYQDYFVVVRMDGETRFSYSLPAAEIDGVAWADEFYGRLPTDTGALVGLGTLDDKLVFFTERAEYVMWGQGPDVTGGANGFSSPQYITGSVGCSNPRSILRVPAGLLRQTSASEIVLLSRTMEEVTAATGVERYAGLTVVGALDVQARREARFFTAEGTTLVWCYEGGQWAVWTEQPAVDAVLYGQVPHYLHSSGAIRKDSATSKAEGGNTTLAMKVGTSWLKYAGIQGAQRIWRMLLLASAECGLTVRCQVYADYDESAPVDTAEWLFPADGVFQVRHFLRRQQCQALRFVFVFEPEEDVGDVSFNGLSLLLGIQRGLARLPATRNL